MHVYIVYTAYFILFMLHTALSANESVIPAFSLSSFRNMGWGTKLAGRQYNQFQVQQFAVTHDTSEFYISRLVVTTG